MITAAQLRPLCKQPEQWVQPLNEAMELYEINTPTRVAPFLAQCAHESGMFERLVENLNYSADGLLRTWPNRFLDRSEALAYARKPERIANHVYALRNGNGNETSGDGWRYRGRGLLQITFRNNYSACEKDTGLPLLDNPGLLEKPSGATQSAGWFWWDNGCNEVADEGDFDGVSGIINRGSRHKEALHLEKRREWLDIARRVI